MSDKVAIWPHAATLSESRFVFKSLSNWSYNIAVGCEHGCTFCYVPSVSTIKLAGPLKIRLGVDNPDAEWGHYVGLREWRESEFRNSLMKAEGTPRELLKADGNRAVLFCSTTDPYQVISARDGKTQEYQMLRRKLVREALVMILERSTLNVRILTRSPLAREDFDLFKRFGKRLMFGMSLPTLDHRLAAVYEPFAPHPLKRLETLELAKSKGLNVFVAMAPTFPECEASDLLATLGAIKQLDPMTIFMEPVNIRAENVSRIKANGIQEGVELCSDVFDTPERWGEYALAQLHLVEAMAKNVGLGGRLHLWPDKFLKKYCSDHNEVAWILNCWKRVSEWPTT